MGSYLAIKDGYYLRRIKRCYLIGVNVALLKEACHWGVDFGVSKAQARPSVSPFTLNKDLNVKLSANCLLVCCHAPHHDRSRIINSERIPIKLFCELPLSRSLFIAVKH